MEVDIFSLIANACIKSVLIFCVMLFFFFGADNIKEKRTKKCVIDWAIAFMFLVLTMMFWKH